MDDQKHILGAVDYVVVAFSLLISTAIGVKFRYFSVAQKTMREYVMAGKNMAVFPVVMSICVTLLSALTMIGSPVETYRYGMQTCLIWIGGVVGTFVSSYLFTPVYFHCEVSTIYEFLEIRYGKVTRHVVSGLFIMQMVFFISVMLYAPVLAISAVTDLSLEMSVIVFGLVCSFYCSIGGLKAVLWTDVFQSGFMITCIIVLYVQGIREGGGLSEIYKISKEGQRWDLNLNVDFTTRYTFWNVVLRGFFGTLAYYGASQIEVQRVQSLRSVKRARAALIWSLLPSLFISLMCKFLGMILYTIFHNCDPVLDGQRTGVKKYDQVVPYYIVTRLSWIPGLTGVCVAGIFSGSLSSISSALNSLSTVTVVDFIKPLFPDKFTEIRTVYIAKALSMLYGVLCIGLTFLISRADSLVTVSGTLIGIMEGPILAIFLVAVLSRKGTEKCILFGLLLGVCFVSWIGYGSLFSGYKYPTLPLNNTECQLANFSSNILPNSTCAIQGNCTEQLTTKSMLIKEPFILYRISFVWIPTIGCFVTLFFIFLAILLTGWSHNVIPADSKCLSPITRLWMRKQHTNKRQIEINDHIELEEKTVLSTSSNQVQT